MTGLVFNKSISPTAPAFVRLKLGAPLALLKGGGGGGEKRTPREGKGVIREFNFS